MKGFKLFLKIVVGSIATIVVMLIAAIFLLRLPSVQNYVTHKAIGFVSSKTHTRIELRRMYLAFPKSIVIEGLFVEDTAHDTLLRLNTLKIDVDMLALLKKKVEVNSLYMEGVNANIERTLPDSSFNFQFLIKAFASNGKKSSPKPDTNKDTVGWQIAVDKLTLENIRGGYSDQLSGTDIHGFIGYLNLKMKSIDIRTLTFTGNELVLSNTNAKMTISGSSTKASVDTIRSLLPAIALNKLTLKNVGFIFENAPVGQTMTIHTGNLSVIPEKIDLNAQIIAVKSLLMDSSEGILAFRKNTSADTSSSYTSTGANNSGWQISAGHLQFKKVDFSYDISNVPALKSGVDYSHLHMRDIALNISDASYSPKEIKGNIAHISLVEHSGFVLKNLTAQAIYDDHHAELNSLSLTTAHTHITNHLSIHYPSIESLGKDIAVLSVDADLQNTYVGLNEVLLFAPVLKNYPPFNNGTGITLAVNGKIKGRLKDITASDLTVTGVGATSISLNAHITGLPDMANALYDIQLKDLATTRQDMQSLIGQYLPASINLPEKIELTGTLKGSFTDASSQLKLQTSDGDADIEASLRRLNGDTQYTATVNAKALNIGYIIRDTALLGPATGNVKITGHNLTPALIGADLEAQIESIRFNKYNYSNISLTATADSGQYKATVNVKDKNLIMDLSADASIANGQDSLQLALNIEGADLQQLNLIEDNMRISGKLNANVSGSIESPNGQVNLSDVTLIKGDDTYRLGNFLVASLNEKKHSAASIKSGIINADYQGTMNLASLGSTITDYVNNYFRITDQKDTILKDTAEQNFALTVNILPHPVITAFLPQIDKFDGADIKADFNSNKQQLDVKASIPGLTYKGNRLDNMHLEVNSDAKALNYSLALDGFSSGNIHLAETTFGGEIQRDSVAFALKVHEVDSGNKLIVSGTLSQEQPGQYVLRLDNNKLVLANQKWNLPADNYISFKRSGFYVHDLNLSKQDQLLSIHSETDDETAPLKIEFRQFELGTLSQVVEDDTTFIRGNMNGTVELRNLQQAMAFVSDLKIDSLSYKQNPIGNVQVKADNLSPGKYSAQVSINGDDNDVQVSGYYAASGNTNQLNFKAAINKLQLHSIEGFTSGQLRKSSGYMTGSVDVTGAANKPAINGNIGFKDAKVNVAYINSDLAFKDEHIQVDEKGVYFHSFHILDAYGQKAIINGSVLTSDFKKMKYDLTVTTDRFTAMNTGINDNPLFFGHVVLSSNLTIKGDESLPVIRADAKLLEGSNFTVVIPSSKITVDRGEGVVILVDTSTSSENDIMKKKDTIPVDIGFKGIDLAANLDINKKTSFKLIVDKTSGDSLSVQGEGQLSFAMDPTGKQTLTGMYTLSGGSYTASFQKVIKRQFKIKDGSTITWNGSPTDATVDITATYPVRTSPADLLSTELAGASSGERNAYQQQLNFTVMMSMKEALLNPVITFQLDMADQDKNAFGGTVYMKINQLNGSDPDDLNRQVFALLVLNSFMPTSLGGGSSGPSPVNTFARNSVNQILSDQLNQLSGRYIKGVDLNFGLQTNDMYGTTGSVQQNTLVSVGVKKEFFKSRLSVQVGTSINVQNSNGAVSQNNTGNVGGDFDIEYKLTKDGRYRVKAFRTSEYDFIDGLIYNTGVGVVFTHDYDTMKQLFAPPPKEKTPN